MTHLALVIMSIVLANVFVHAIQSPQIAGDHSNRAGTRLLGAVRKVLAGQGDLLNRVPHGGGYFTRQAQGYQAQTYQGQAQGHQGQVQKYQGATWKQVAPVAVPYSREELDRTGRNTVQMAVMMTCETGRVATDYLNYGCFCGLGGRGSRPMDEVDR